MIIFSLKAHSIFWPETICAHVWVDMQESICLPLTFWFAQQNEHLEMWWSFASFSASRLLFYSVCVILVLMSLHHIKAQLLLLIRVWPLKVTTSKSGHCVYSWAPFDYFFFYFLISTHVAQLFGHWLKKQHDPFRHTYINGRLPVQYCTSCLYIICFI